MKPLSSKKGNIMNLAFNAALKNDVNQVINQLKKHKIVTVEFEHLLPEVLIDTPQHYLARYTDQDGDYEFEITKTSAGWKVTSSGMVIGTFKDPDYIKWDFESQLAKYTPKVLG
jgi:hypothetical protein